MHRTTGIVLCTVCFVGFVSLAIMWSLSGVWVAVGVSSLCALVSVYALLLCWHSKNQGKEKDNKITGKLYGFFETGTEGVCWELIEDDKTGYDALVSIEPGDHLKVYNEDGSVAFNDVIVCDFKTGLEVYNKKFGHKHQCALGYWIHWIQKGWQPDDWAALFIRDGETKPFLRAELVKKTKK